MASGDDRTHIGQRLACLQHCALHRRTITLTCPRCGHVRRFDAVALWWLFERRGWDDRISVVPGRLHCKPCRAESYGRVRPSLAITREPPDADQPPYPDEREWKRVVSRYRS